MDKKDCLTVNQLTRYIKRKFDFDPYLQKNLWIVGKLTNFKQRARHQYFSLKDDDAPEDQQAVIDAVMFGSDWEKVDFTPENGMEVILGGKVTVYERNGRYQFYVNRMLPVGVSAAQLAFQETYKKLKASGVFSHAQNPRPLNRFPKRIAIVTSNDGAVKHDMITRIRNNNPLTQVVFYPAQVQGERAAEDLARQIQRAGINGTFDTLIVARGGGSEEDLMPFNSEIVARAVAASPIPVISGVGHETDTTICDLAADYRAQVPGLAAEMATQLHLLDILTELQRARTQMANTIQNQLQQAQQQLQVLTSSYVFSQPARLYEGEQQHVDQLTEKLQQSMQWRLSQISHDWQRLLDSLLLNAPANRLQQNRQQLTQLQQAMVHAMDKQLLSAGDRFKNLLSQLDSLSPLKVMARGYSYVTKEDNKVVASTSQLQPDEQVALHFSDGTAEAVIKKINKR